MDADTRLSRATGPGCALRRAGGAAMSSGSRSGGGEAGDRDDLGHLLDPGVRGIALAGVLAVLRAQCDALAVALHHDHVAGLRARVRAAGPFLVEAAGPGGQVRGQAGQLRPPDPHPGPVPDDLLGLPVPAGRQVTGRQGAHPQRVRVIGQHPPGIGRVQVRLAPVTAGQPRRPDRPEDARKAPVMAFLHAAVADPRRARDLHDPLLPRPVDREGGLQQLPLQLPARLADHRLPLPVISAGRVSRGPRDHLRELPRRTGQRRGQLTVQRALAAVLVHLRHRHRDRNRHRRASVTAAGIHGGHSGPGSQNRTRNRRTRQRGTARPVTPTGSPHCRRPAHITLGNARCVRKRTDTPISGIVQADIRTRSRPSKRRTQFNPDRRYRRSSCGRRLSCC